MNMFAILFLLILATNGCGGQYIEVNISTHSALCQEGFRAGIDSYDITGTVGPNYTTFVRSGWIPAIYIQVLPVGETEFITICSVRIGDTAQYCSPTVPELCYCNNITATGVVPFVVTSPTLIGNSYGTVRGEWQHRNTSKLHSTKNITIPAIYDVNAADLKLYVNNAPADNTSESCGVKFKDNAMNTIKLCCSNAATPCNPRLAFNGTVVTLNQSLPCVEHTFTANATVNVTMSYSMCTLTDYIPRGFCVIETKKPHKDDTDLIIGLVVGLLLALILAVVLIYCYKKYAKKKSRPIESQNANNKNTVGGAENMGMTIPENINEGKYRHPPQQGPAPIASTNGNNDRPPVRQLPPLKNKKY